jgi:hypothetical protein
VVGTVDEFYFDDHHWTVRYLVADTGNWLTGRQVLISPYALTSVHPEGQYITVDLTRKQIEESPSLDSDKPVSRQFEESYYNYYGWPMYWGGPFMWGSYPNLVRERADWGESNQSAKAWDPHLRSTGDVDNHHVEAIDGAIGHVEDFLIDDSHWAVRYMLVNTNNWLPGKHVLISPRWIDRVSWTEKKVFIGLTREAIEHSPEFSPRTLLDREYEISLHRHYDRHGYWLDELEAVKKGG